MVDSKVLRFSKTVWVIIGNWTDYDSGGLGWAVSATNSRELARSTAEKLTDMSEKLSKELDKARGLRDKEESLNEDRLLTPRQFERLARLEKKIRARHPDPNWRHNATYTAQEVPFSRFSGG